MGNRAVITTAPYNPNAAGIYLHWNGGQASIEGFITACRDLGYRDPASDPAYALARLTAAACAFFPDGLSVGLGIVKNLDCSDNGIYCIGKNWQIEERHKHPRDEEINPEKTAGIAARVTNALTAIKTATETA